LARVLVERANERDLNSWIFTIYVWELDSSESYVGKEKKRKERSLIFCTSTQCSLTVLEVKVWLGFGLSSAVKIYTVWFNWGFGLMTVRSKIFLK